MNFRIFDHKKTCERCGKEVMARLVRTVAQNGANQVYWWCIAGEHRIVRASHLIPHDKLREFGIDPDTLPIQENYSGASPCVVCGSVNTEYHHFAPRHLFEDADNWPGAYLCKPHHTHWHNTVTPNMSRRRDK